MSTSLRVTREVQIKRDQARAKRTRSMVSEDVKSKLRKG